MFFSVLNYEVLGWIVTQKLITDTDRDKGLTPGSWAYTPYCLPSWHWKTIAPQEGVTFFISKVEKWRNVHDDKTNVTTV